VSKVSILIPSREEPFLQRTIDDLLLQRDGDVEIIALLDGWWPNPPLKDDPHVKQIHWTVPQGLRSCLNAGARVATGDYLLKIDAHCAVSEGYDVELAKVCGDDSIVVPAKYSLNADTWTRYREPWQYFYLTFPWDPTLNHPGLHDKACGPDVNAARAHIQPIDDILSYQGSAWFLTKQHFERIGPMDPARYYVAQEPQELGLATWLNGGRVVIHKGVWYAHLWKGRDHKRGFRLIKPRWVRALRASAEHWMAQSGFPALVEKFWDVLHEAPVGPWPDDWQDPKYRVAIDARKAAV
jgi:glycosyltransferase involved in cell wall biosynthesis